MANPRGAVVYTSMVGYQGRWGMSSSSGRTVNNLVFLLGHWIGSVYVLILNSSLLNIYS